MNLLTMMTAAASLSVVAPATASEAIIGRNNITLTSDRMTPEALWAMGRIGNVTPSPDGKHIVYVVRYYSVEQNKSRATLHRINADGSGHVQLTAETASESEPCFMPGGQQLAFLSNQGGSQQVWQMNIDGTGRRQLSRADRDVEGFKFSPDGKSIILIHSVPTTASIEARPDDLPLTTGMVINELNYKHWDHYITEIPHIFIAPFDGNVIGKGKDLLDGQPYECPSLPFGGNEEFTWSPDSRYILYSCRKKTGTDYVTSTDTDIYQYDTTTGQTTNLCKPSGWTTPAYDPTRSLQQQTVNAANEDIQAGYDNCPQYSPDGKYVAWTSMERDGYESDRTRLCVMECATGRKSYVTESFRSGVDAFAWSADSKNIYFVGVWEAVSSIYRTNLKGEVQLIAGGDYDYSSVTVNGKDIIAMRHSLSAPDDIYCITPDKKGKKPAAITALTNENEYYMSRLTMGDVKERWVETSDGKRMKCWVIYPPHFDPSKKYPTVLFCQGGPQSPVSQFWSYRWNFQVMAAQDYIIVAPNRRGLPGFGMEWLEEISGDYSGRCMQDYLEAIDDICKESYVDTERLGCVGASFGGYSVYWLAGNHNKRFKCFIAHDGIFNTQQQYFETEEMWFPNWDLGAAPWRRGITDNTAPTGKDAPYVTPEGKTNPYTTSPHLYVDRWDTPILCIHGEKDYRILASQGQSAFAAARLRGIPAQLLLFPDENHWVLRPQNGMLWQRTFLGWLNRWLKHQ